MLRIDTATPTAVTTTFTSFGHSSETSSNDDYELAEALVYVDKATYHFITGNHIHIDIEV